jgi:drug/metabolite transporter (DMT)-like permease
MRLKADFTLFIVSIIWGTAFVAQRIVGQQGGVNHFNGVRYILAGLIVLPFALYVRRKESHTEVLYTPSRDIPREQYKWMFIAGFLLFVAASFQQAGMQYTTAGNAGFITSLYVVLVPFVLLVGWKEKPHWLSVIAAGMAGFGAYLLSTGGRFDIQIGDAMELIGALFWAMHVVIVGKFATRFDAISFSVGQLLVCGFLNLIVGVFVEEPIFTRSVMIAVIYTAVMSLGLCYTLQVWAQRHTPPSDAALIFSLESVFAVLAGWIFLDEYLAAIQIAGCILIFFAVGMSQFKDWGLRGTIDIDHLVEGR